MRVPTGAIRIALLLIAVLAIALTACNQGTASEPTSTPAPAASSDTEFSSLAVLQSPDGEDIFLAGSADGIFTTRRDGEWKHTWAPRHENFVHTIAHDPSLPGVVYATTELAVLKSDNYGETWADISGGQFSAVLALAVHARENGGTTVAVIAQHTFKGRGAFITYDDGGTWLNRGGGPQRGISFLSDGTLVGGGSLSERHVMVLSATGPDIPLNWEPVEVDERIGAIAVAGRDRSEFTAFMNGSQSLELRIASVSAEGVTVTRTGHNLTLKPPGCSWRGYGFDYVCVQEVVPARDFLESGRAVAVIEGSISITTDRGQTWQHWPALPERVRAMAVDGERIYVVEGGWVNMVSYRGAPWQQVKQLP